MAHVGGVPVVQREVSLIVVRSLLRINTAFSPIRLAIDNRPSTSPGPLMSGTRKNVQWREKPAGQTRVSHARNTGIPARARLRTTPSELSVPPTTTAGITGHPWASPHGHGRTRNATSVATVASGRSEQRPTVQTGDSTFG